MAAKGGVTTLAILALVLSYGLGSAEAQGQCSRTSPCPDAAHCCSKWGYCGTGDPYCGDGCQARPCSGGGGPSPPRPPTPPSPPSGPGLGAILTQSVYQRLFPRHLPFHSYNALIEIAKTFPEFGTTGDTDTRKREIAAYAAHVTHETSGTLRGCPLLD